MRSVPRIARGKRDHHHAHESRGDQQPGQRDVAAHVPDGVEAHPERQRGAGREDDAFVLRRLSRRRRSVRRTPSTIPVAMSARTAATLAEIGSPAIAERSAATAPSVDAIAATTPTLPDRTAVYSNTRPRMLPAPASRSHPASTPLGESSPRRRTGRRARTRRPSPRRGWERPRGRGSLGTSRAWPRSSTTPPRSRRGWPSSGAGGQAWTARVRPRPGRRVRPRSRRRSPGRRSGTVPGSIESVTRSVPVWLWSVRRRAHRTGSGFSSADQRTCCPRRLHRRRP